MQAVLKGRFGAPRPAANAKENSNRGAAAGPPATNSPRKMKAKQDGGMEGCEGLCASLRSKLGAADVFAEGSAAFAQVKVSSRMTVHALSRNAPSMPSFADLRYRSAGRDEAERGDHCRHCRGRARESQPRPRDWRHNREGPPPLHRPSDPCLRKSPSPSVPHAAADRR